MMYEEFKTELFHAVKELQGAAGKEILIVEKGKLCRIAGLEDMTGYLNLSCGGREDGEAAADFLLVVWREGCRTEWRSWVLKECYDRFSFGGWQEILPEVEERLKGRKGLGGGFMKSRYEDCRSELILRPVSLSQDRERLTDGIFWERGEFALALFGVIRMTENELVTLKITREVADGWNVSDNTLLADALYRTGLLLPPRLYREDDEAGRYNLWNSTAGSRVAGFGDAGHAEGGIHLASMGGRLFCFPQEGGMQCVAEDRVAFGTYGLRLTNAMRTDGAAVFFYPGVGERLAELLGGDYYVVFPSVHEAWVYSAGEEAVRRLRLATGRNVITGSARHRLTDRVYRYCRDRRELVEA